MPFFTEAYLTAWLRAFLFTQIVEVPIYRRGLPTSWGAAFGASTITHPFVWFFFPWIAYAFDVSWYLTATASELFAWGIEALWFWSLGKKALFGQPAISGKRAIVVSLAANAASLGLGLVSRALFGVP